MTLTLSETLAAKKQKTGWVNTYLLELKQIKRDQIEVRWNARAVTHKFLSARSPLNFGRPNGNGISAEILGNTL
jgi:hypothetical protein